MPDTNKKRAVWDATGERYFEAGVDHGMLYVQDSKTKAYGEGVPWNGLINVTDSPSGAEDNAFYADNIKYASLKSAEESSGTIEAYTYPKEFEPCDGNVEPVAGLTIGQQPRNMFCFCYRTMIGNDQSSSADIGYKLHLVYNASAAPSEKSRDTINDSPEAMTFSWEYSTLPINVKNHKPTSCLKVDSRYVDPTKLAALEEILYGKDPTAPDGDDGVAPRIPLPDEVITLITAE